MSARDASPSPTDSAPPAAASGGEVSLLWLTDTLWQARRTLLWFTVAGLVAGAALALLRGRTYTTTFSFLPQASQDGRSGLGGMAGLAGLAGQFGIPLGLLGGSQTPPQLYADLLLTREVLVPIVADSVRPDGPGTPAVSVPKYLRAKGRTEALLVENTLRKLRRNVIASAVVARSTGMVTVRVRTRSPHVSQTIAEQLLVGLNHFNLVTRQSQAREERQFSEARLAEAKATLRRAEDALQAFISVNRVADGSPALRFEQGRLDREVQLQQQVVSTLAQQYEEHRIREVRDTPVITVFERPVPAARGDSGILPMIVAMATGIGLLLGLVWVLGRDAVLGERRRLREAGLA